MIRKMKLFAVLETSELDDEVDTTLFVNVYTTKRAAVQAIELAARETWESFIDPNEGDDRPFPGVEITSNADNYFMELAKSSQVSWEIITVKVV